jgi:hypothetical protein
VRVRRFVDFLADELLKLQKDMQAGAESTKLYA